MLKQDFHLEKYLTRVYIIVIKGGGYIMAKEQQSKNQKNPQSVNDLREEIRRRAEEIYIKRGGSPGDEMSDWLEAEKEIKKKYGIK
jgi:hypothetical protein